MADGGSERVRLHQSIGKQLAGISAFRIRRVAHSSSCRHGDWSGGCDDADYSYSPPLFFFSTTPQISPSSCWIDVMFVQVVWIGMQADARCRMQRINVRRSHSVQGTVPVVKMTGANPFHESLWAVAGGGGAGAGWGMGQLQQSQYHSHSCKIIIS